MYKRQQGLQAYLIRGSKPGKTLAITAGVHGCEYVSIQAAREFVNDIEPQSLSGNVLVIPVVNEQGFFKGAKQIVPEDGLNLNRRFPGSSHGTITDRIAYAVETVIYPAADFLIDLHGGDVHELSLIHI